MNERELLQCYDDQRHPVEHRTRAEVYVEPRKFWAGCASIFVVSPDGALLCSKRSSRVQNNPGKWQACFGGHVKAGETFLSTAINELYEEAGLVAQPENLLPLESGTNLPLRYFFENYMFVFGGPVTGLAFNDGEVSEARWLEFRKYNEERWGSPKSWCNGCSPENQQRIRQALEVWRGR